MNRDNNLLGGIVHLVIVSIMHLKGIEKLREKLPDYPGNRIRLLPLRGLVTIIISYLFLIVLDILPRMFSSIDLLVLIEPYLPILGNVLLTGIAFWLIGLLWSKRDSMIEKYGDLAYQKMIPTGAIGVFLIPPLIFHAATSIRSLPPMPPVNDLTILWSQSILPLIGLPSEIDILLRVSISLIFLLLGMLTVRSAFLTFGIDYMTVVYVYFPDESEIQEFEIYSVVRHPTYLGGVLLAIAAAVFRFSVYSLILGFLGYLVFKLQTRREDEELLQRFGQSFRDYMDRINALCVKPRSIGTYLKFLRGPPSQ